MMQTFTEHVTTPGHLPHLEDLLLYEGGVDDIQRVFRALDGQPLAPTITMKWDGAPSILFGPDPNDGQFFIATKSAFNITPKYIRDLRDVELLYPDSPLREILTVCWHHLVVIAPPIILQGDVLFGPDMTAREINGVMCWVFRPNTLTYAVDVMSPLGQAMTGRSFGIALHTMYPVTSEERSLRRLQPVPLTPQVFSQLRRDPATLLLDVEQTVIPERSEDPETFLGAQDFLERVATVQRFVPSSDVVEIMQRFLNHCVRTGIDVTIDNLMVYIITRQTVELQKRSTSRGKAAVTARFAVFLTFVQQERARLQQWIACYAAVVRLKLLYLRRLNATSPVQTFIDRDGILESTAPEGFVVTLGDLRVKLVDRREFSHLNFQYRQF
jgi:hypothetical protein